VTVSQVQSLKITVIDGLYITAVGTQPKLQIMEYKNKKA